MKNIQATVLVFAAAACLAQPSPQSAKQLRKQEARLRKELEPAYKKWREEDVLYIITDEEKQAFTRLSTDEEREQFVEQFWLRRDPTPDTSENEFKEEHYRRIAYANERFASGIPGWKTDRGRIYIVFGPPDEVDPHPSGGAYQSPIEEGGGQITTYPFEKWRYRYIEGIGNDVNIEFVDPTMTGEYRMTMDPSEKNALAHVPTTGTRPQPPPGSANFFERQRVFVDLQRATAARFRDLEATVNSTLRFNTLPMSVRADYIRITDATVLSNITLQFDRKDLQFQRKDTISSATVNLYARITSLSRRVVNVFEDVVTVDGPTGWSVYQKSVPLPPGVYRLNIVAKDIVGGNIGTHEMVLDVPRFEEDKLASSSLILADLIEKVPTTNIGTGQFVIGDTKVRPRLNQIFGRDEKLGIYQQFYNFGADGKTRKPSGSIQYQIVKAGSEQPSLDYTEDISTISGASARQVTVEKLLSIATLDPGQYTLKMRVTDKIRDQTVTGTASFTVR